MTDAMNDEKAVVELDAAQPHPAVASDELVRQLAERARAEGLRLTGEGWAAVAAERRWWSNRRSTASSTITSATESTIRPAVTAAIPETASAAKPS